MPSLLSFIATNFNWFYYCTMFYNSRIPFSIFPFFFLSIRFFKNISSGSDPIKMCHNSEISYKYKKILEQRIQKENLENL